jgi:hypothetical protein
MLATCCALVSARLIFDPEGLGHTFLRKVGSHTDYKMLYPRRPKHSFTAVEKPKSYKLHFIYRNDQHTDKF